MSGIFHSPLRSTSRLLVLCSAILMLGCMGWGRKPLDGAVEMRDGRFMVRNEPFYPFALNYIIALHVHGDSVWAGPSKDYARVDPSERPSRSAMHTALRADMELIHEAGFNTVRLVGIGELLRS